MYVYELVTSVELPWFMVLSGFVAFIVRQSQPNIQGRGCKNLLLEI